MIRLAPLAMFWLLIAPIAHGAAPDESRARLQEEAYAAAQGAIASGAADALSNAALTFTAANDELANLIRERTKLGYLIAVAADDLAKLPSTGGGADRRAREQQLITQRMTAERELAGVNDQLQRRYPAFTELIRPQPLTAAQTQAVLNDDEALLLIVPALDASYLFVVTRQSFEWRRAPHTADRIDAAVRELRNGIDGARGAFNRQLAAELYRWLIEPAEDLLAGKKVIFTATTGALQSLPLSALITRAADSTDAAQVEWLIDRYALVTLPAVSSLLSLRCYAVGTTRHQGCPPIAASIVRPAAIGGLMYAGIGAPALPRKPDPKGSNRGSVEGTSVFRGNLADPDELRRRYQFLPAAQPELQQVSTGFPAGAVLVATGQQATETLVKTSREVAGARILHFATHAALSNETDINEPGLVLTPPASRAQVTTQDDGFLAASEIAALKLSAQFVVLSACNTARTDGRLNADGLNGLARAFFYSGAQSLLVSHWAVDDAPTARLIIATFAASRSTPGLGRAEALREAMQRVRRTHPEPKFWAPFILVGER